MGGTRKSDQGGKSVSLSTSGTTIAIGVPGYDGLSHKGSKNRDGGRVDVYEWDGTSWNRKGPLAQILGSQRVWAGSYVSLSGDGQRVAVSFGGADYGALNSGSVVVWDFDGSNWYVLDFVSCTCHESIATTKARPTTTNMTHTRTQLIGNGRDMSMATPRTIGLVAVSLYPKMVTDSLQARPETMERAPTPEW